MPAPEGRSADAYAVTPAPLLVLLQPSYGNMPNEAMLEGVASGSGFVAGNAASYCLPSGSVGGASFSFMPSSSFPCVSSSTFPSSSLIPPSCSGTDEAAENTENILGIESVDSVSPSSSPYPFYSSEEIVKEEEEIEDRVGSVSVPFSHTPHGTIKEGIVVEEEKMHDIVGSASVPSSHYPYDTNEEQIVKGEEEMDESVGYVRVTSPHYPHYKSEEEIVKEEEEVNASNEDTEQEFLCGSRECEDPGYEMPQNDASDDESLFCFVGISSQDDEKPAATDSQW